VTLRLTGGARVRRGERSDLLDVWREHLLAPSVPVRPSYGSSSAIRLLP
jgi:hypothetical protein